MPTLLQDPLLDHQVHTSAPVMPSQHAVEGCHTPLDSRVRA